MKKAILFSLVALCSISKGWTQSTMAIFAENGERFWAIVNGKRQNPQPEYRVEDISLTSQYGKLKIIFEDASISEINKSIVAFDKETCPTPCNTIYSIRKNKKGIYKVRIVDYSTNKVEKAPQVTVQSQERTVSHSITRPIHSHSYSSTTTTTTTKSIPSSEGVSMSVGGNSNGESVEFKMNVDDDNNQKVGININMNGGVSGSSESHSSHTVTKTTTSSSSYSTNVEGGHVVYSSPEPIIYVPGYDGRIGCEVPMSSSRFRGAKSSIATRDFEDRKLSTAKQIIRNACMTTSQVREIIGLFDFESTKLDFAKVAYDRTYDIDNYYLLNDSFNFDSSIDELNDHIHGNGSDW